MVRNGRELLKGLSAAVPIAIGYVPIAVAFGVIARQSGLPFAETVLMSMMVFAGASQFMAVQMATAGALGMEIIFATLVLNFRHFIMSLSLMDRLKDVPLLAKGALAFGVTDETFAVAAMDEKGGNKRIHPLYMVGLIAVAYGSWVFGTVVGALFAGVIPQSISDSMNIALYAMFIALLIPAVRKRWWAGAVALIGMALNALFGLFLSGGWATVLATVAAAGCGAYLMPKDQSPAPEKRRVERME